MRLDLRLLEIFCCVYSERSFSKAGEKLLLSQPTISGHIKNLEDQLEVKLFNRLPRTIVPTQAADILYRHGQAVLSEREATLQELQQFLNRLSGSLVLSASTVPGEYLLPRVMASFHSLYPGVKLEVKITDSSRACREVLDGSSELGCVGARIEDADLQFRRFAEDELVLLARKDEDRVPAESISLDQLLLQPFLARELGSGTRMVFEKSVGSSLDRFNVVASLGSNNAIKEGLRSGLGLSVVSLLSVRRELERGLLRTLSIEGVEPMRRDFYLVVNRRLKLSPIAETFLKHLLDSRPEITPTDDGPP